MARWIFLLSFILVALTARSQGTADTIKSTVADSTLEKQHSPTKATLFSVALPGLGQIYNKKYWKVPVIYAGFGVLTYFIVTNAKEYNKYKQAYIQVANHDSTGNYFYLGQKYTEQNLISARDYYRRNLEVSVLLSAVLYILNILDATVDANLYTYNIGNELSLRVEPMVIPSFNSRNVTSGIKLCLKF